jgi:hypothetical protein
LHGLQKHSTAASRCAATSITVPARGWTKQLSRVQALTTALQTLLVQPNDACAFVIIEDVESKKFVQFVGSLERPLLLDLPAQSLSETEFYRAVLFFRRRGVGGQEYELLRARRARCCRAIRVSAGHTCVYHLPARPSAEPRADLAVIVAFKSFGGSGINPCDRSIGPRMCGFFLNPRRSTVKMAR